MKNGLSATSQLDAVGAIGLTWYGPAESNMTAAAIGARAFAGNPSPRVMRRSRCTWNDGKTVWVKFIGTHEAYDRISVRDLWCSRGKTWTFTQFEINAITRRLCARSNGFGVPGRGSQKPTSWKFWSRS
jgi:hypothetical protein